MFFAIIFSLFGIFALLFAIFFRQHIVILIYLAIGISAQIFPSVVAAMFWKRATNLAAFLAMLTGLSIIIYGRIIVGVMLYKGIQIEFWALIINTVVLVVVSYLTTQPDNAKSISRGSKES